jgi:hypothetical protein
MARASASAKIAPLRRIIVLYTIITALLALWLIGLLIHVGGALIHLLLVVAVVLFLYRLVSGGSNPGSGAPKTK